MIFHESTSWLNGSAGLCQAQLILAELSQVCAVSWHVDWEGLIRCRFRQNNFSPSAHLSFPPGGYASVWDRQRADRNAQELLQVSAGVSDFPHWPKQVTWSSPD